MTVTFAPYFTDRIHAVLRSCCIGFMRLRRSAAPASGSAFRVGRAYPRHLLDSKDLSVKKSQKIVKFR